MIEANRVGAILLAAGLSTRFGSADKLVQPYRGEPLVYHAANVLAGFPFKTLVAVVHGSASKVLPSAFECVFNDRPEAGLSNSIQLGVERAAGAGVSAILIMLGDMPNVTTAHIGEMLDRFDASDPRAILCSRAGGRPMPPVLFGPGHFPALATLKGDSGARDMLGNAPFVEMAVSEAADCDEPGDFG